MPCSTNEAHASQAIHPQGTSSRWYVSRTTARTLPRAVFRWNLKVDAATSPAVLARFCTRITMFQGKKWAMRDKRSRWCNLHMTGSTHTPAYGHYRNKSSDTTLNMIARSSLFTVAHRAALDPTATSLTTAWHLNRLNACTAAKAMLLSRGDDVIGREMQQVRFARNEPALCRKAGCSTHLIESADLILFFVFTA